MVIKLRRKVVDEEASKEAGKTVYKSEWIPFYTAWLKNRLRKDLNLGDLDDKAEARTNLGLIGDVSNIKNPHNHDARYIPMIEEEAEKRENETSELLKKLDELAAKQDEDVATIVHQIAVKEEEAETRAQEIETHVEKVKNSLEQTQDEFENNLGDKIFTMPPSDTMTTEVLQVARTGRVSGGGWNRNNTYTDRYRVLTTDGAIKEGRYTLQSLLEQLVKNSHKHEITTKDYTYQCECVCDCNCDCSSDCGDDDGGD